MVDKNLIKSNFFLVGVGAELLVNIGVGVVTPQPWCIYLCSKYVRYYFVKSPGEYCQYFRILKSMNWYSGVFSSSRTSESAFVTAVGYSNTIATCGLAFIRMYVCMYVCPRIAFIAAFVVPDITELVRTVHTNIHTQCFSNILQSKINLQTDSAIINCPNSLWSYASRGKSPVQLPHIVSRPVV